MPPTPELFSSFRGWIAASLLTLFLLVLPAFLISCTPQPPVAPGFQTDSIPIQLQQSRNQRLAQLKLWEVVGVIDLETPEAIGRHRFELLGDGIKRARLRVFGPFRQVVHELYLAPERIVLMDGVNKRLVETPADGNGLSYLVGIGLGPEELLRMILGWGDLTGLVHQGGGYLEAPEGEGDRLRLDPVTGQLTGWWKEAGSSPFYAGFSWNDEVAIGVDEKVQESMPARIRVSWDFESTLMLILKTWRFPKMGEGSGLAVPELPSGFVWERPFGEESR
ncbi:MAG: hypothetical protein HQL52_16945 [Magnetococcales bacterium]|nr:hypothetical protein [Magnetococcales bacterium]